MDQAYLLHENSRVLNEHVSDLLICESNVIERENLTISDFRYFSAFIAMAYFFGHEQMSIDAQKTWIFSVNLCKSFYPDVEVIFRVIND